MLRVPGSLPGDPYKGCHSLPCTWSNTNTSRSRRIELKTKARESRGEHTRYREREPKTRIHSFTIGSINKAVKHTWWALIHRAINATSGGLHNHHRQPERPLRGSSEVCSHLRRDLHHPSQLIGSASFHRRVVLTE